MDTPTNTYTCTRIRRDIRDDSCSSTSSDDDEDDGYKHYRKRRRDQGESSSGFDQDFFEAEFSKRRKVCVLPMMYGAYTHV